MVGWRARYAAGNRTQDFNLRWLLTSRVRSLRDQSSKVAQLDVLRCADTERHTIAALDAAVAPIIMQPPALRLVVKTVKKMVETDHRQPSLIASSLDSLEEGCFLSAAQAVDIMRVLENCVEVEKRHEFWHIVIARVVDKWRLSEREHTQVFCYYGWEPSYAAQLVRDTPLESAIALQNKVLSHMGRADHVEFARSQRLTEFASRLIAANLAAGSSGTRHDE